MFEAVELGLTVSREEYDDRVRVLRRRLIEVQAELKDADFAVVVLFGGVDGAGKGELANLLNWWMDPRLIVTRAWERPTPSEAERPEYWRFWRDLPPKGRIGIFLRAWYSKPLLQYVHGVTDLSAYDAQIRRVVDFERMLTDDGMLLLKFWMHLGKEAQAERFRELEADPDQAWRVTARDWRHWNMYDDFVSGSQRLIAGTSQPRAEWTIVDGRDPHHRALIVGDRILAELTSALEEHRERSKRRGRKPRRQKNGEREGDEAAAVAASASVLDTLDMSQALSKSEYQAALRHWQGRLNRLARRAAEEHQSTVLVFEGWDAAGKGGAIRRLTAALDARWYRVVPIGPPTDEEGSHHYLWRFWRHLTRAGRILIFDRSWYGRVLVERVEDLATEAEWRRAYHEVNEFERRLTDHGMLVLKFWLHITDEEQRRRFKEREQTPHKRWKLTAEDRRNRRKRRRYVEAVTEMVRRTSTSEAPWILVEANDKSFARIRVLQEVSERLEAALGPPTDRTVSAAPQSPEVLGPTSR